MTRAPFGSWPSPLSAADLVAGAVGVAFPVQAGGRLIWQEARPEEAGRTTIVASSLVVGSDTLESSQSEPEEVLPAQMSARTTAHEYGGLCWAAGGPQGQLLVSSNQADQRLWLVRPGPARPLTPPPPSSGDLRYAAPTIAPDGKWVVAVRESHSDGDVHNDLVAVPIGAAGADAGEPPEPLVVASGHDFYSWPALSPSGSHLAYVTWDQPDMPWDATCLWVTAFDNGHVGPALKVGPGSPASVVQPKWLPVTASGQRGLAWISDERGWWSPYRDGEILAGLEADFARPAWAFGDSDYAFVGGNRMLATWRKGGRSYLGYADAGEVVAFDLPFTEFSHLSPYRSPSSEGVLAVAAGPREPSQVVAIDASGEWSVLRRSRPAPEATESISEGEHFRFATAGGVDGHAIFYPPRLAGWEGPVEQPPPLLVTSHGGPTDQASTAFQPRTQFWTTRGFAVVDVDYRGSSGYGRAYREALEGGWGVSDVDDCARAALWLGERGWADPESVLFRGSSSSGLTVLAALARYGWIRGGVARYPVCDIGEISGAPKFESRYLERLVPAGQVRERSPIGFAGRVRAPVLLLHGTEDRVVPCSTTVGMADAIRAAGGEPALVLLEGEGHGFRQVQNVVRSQMLELAFVCQVLGIRPAGDMGRAWDDLQRARGDGGAVWRQAPPR